MMRHSNWMRLPLLGGLLIMVTQVMAAAPQPPGDDLEVAPGTLPRQLVVDGVLEPVDQGTVAAQTQGRILALHVDVNDLVPAGAVLLEITSTGQAAGLSRAEAAQRAAEAQQADAQSQLRRIQALYAKGTVSRREYDAAQAQAKSATSAVEQAKAAVIQARESLSYTKVVAPYAGVVSARHVSVGETVSPGQPLLSGFALNRLRVVADVPQSQVPALKPEQGFTLTMADGEQLTLKDYQLFQYAEPGSHSFRLRLNLPEQESLHWLPGQWVKLALPLGERPALLVPQSAVLRQSELSAVYVRQGQTLSLRQVRLGESREQQVEVLAGLEPGEHIAPDAWAVVKAQGGHYAP